MTFDTFLAIGEIALLIFLASLFIAWATKHPFVTWVSKHGTIILRGLFLAAVTSSLIYSEYFGFPPCILCWYQRLAIFPITILLFTTTLKNFLLKQQVLLFASLGFAFALLHNYIDIFQPSGFDVCGSDGVSCSARYVYEFGFITIPLMSATVLALALVITLISKRFPQE